MTIQFFKVHFAKKLFNSQQECDFKCKQSFKSFFFLILVKFPSQIIVNDPFSVIHPVCLSPKHGRNDIVKAFSNFSFSKHDIPFNNYGYKWVFTALHTHKPETQPEKTFQINHSHMHVLYMEYGT